MDHRRLVLWEGWWAGGRGRARWDQVTNGVAPETASWLPRCPGSWRGWGPGWWLWVATGRAAGQYRRRRRRRLAALPALPPPPVQEDKLHEMWQRWNKNQVYEAKGALGKVGQNNLDIQFSVTKKLQITVSTLMATIVCFQKKIHGRVSRKTGATERLHISQSHHLPLLGHPLLVPLPFGLQLFLCRQDLSDVDPRLIPGN